MGGRLRSVKLNLFPFSHPHTLSLTRAVIEKYARNTRFCLICNYVSKIIPALQSRCTRFRFAPLDKDAILGRLQYIVDKEGLTSRYVCSVDSCTLQCIMALFRLVHASSTPTHTQAGSCQRAARLFCSWGVATCARY